MSTRDWDAATYDRISAPQQKWAAEQLDRLRSAATRWCSTPAAAAGRSPLELARRVPRGTVYAVDAAPSMVAHTRQTLGDTAIVSCQDLAQLALPEPVDVIFSNATFHWIPDHDALFAALHRNLKPGGRLLAQCGGRGNIDAFRTARRRGRRAGAVRRVLRRLGGAVELRDRRGDRRAPDGAPVSPTSRTWLEDRPTELDEPRPFIATVCLVRHLDPLPDALRDRFVDTVMDRLERPVVLDYVRLNMTARRAA